MHTLPQISIFETIWFEKLLWAFKFNLVKEQEIMKSDVEEMEQLIIKRNNIQLAWNDLGSHQKREKKSKPTKRKTLNCNTFCFHKQNANSNLCPNLYARIHTFLLLLDIFFFRRWCVRCVGYIRSAHFRPGNINSRKHLPYVLAIFSFNSNLNSHPLDGNGVHRIYRGLRPLYLTSSVK